MKACPFCAEQVQESARVCRFCNRALPVDCATISRLGAHYAIGGTTGGEYAIWDLTTGEIATRYPSTAKNWQKAWAYFLRLDTQAKRRSAPWGWVALALALFVAYVVVHALVFRNCVISPGLFQWPSVCF